MGEDYEKLKAQADAIRAKEIAAIRKPLEDELEITRAELQIARGVVSISGKEISERDEQVEKLGDLLEAELERAAMAERERDAALARVREMEASLREAEEGWARDRGQLRRSLSERDEARAVAGRYLPDDPNPMLIGCNCDRSLTCSWCQLTDAGKAARVARHEQISKDRAIALSWAPCKEGE